MRTLPVVIAAAFACSARPAYNLSTTAVSDVAVGPELARTAGAEVHREDPAQGVPAAVTLAKQHGGWAESIAAERVVLRVPDDQLDTVLAELPKLGDVASCRVQAIDVGEKHRDLQVRIDSLRRSRDRYLALLDRAQNVTEAAGVEKEIERVTAELERLEAQLATTEKQIRFSSLSVDFSRNLRPGPVGWVFYALFNGVRWLFVWD